MERVARAGDRQRRPACCSCRTWCRRCAASLTTCYAPLPADDTTEALTEALAAAYADAPFVRVLPPGEMVDSKRVRGINVVELQAVADPRTGHAVVVGAVDNLVKGAAGQAIQNMNLMLGLDETAGLPPLGVYP